jgi:hypothetical protein
VSRAPRPLAERFWPRVNKDGHVPHARPELGRCWIWTGAISDTGYGKVGLGGRSDGTANTHAVAFAPSGGVVPPGLELDHLCRNRACVNPAHLEPVTRLVNVHRGMRFKKGRAA